MIKGRTDWAKLAQERKDYWAASPSASIKSQLTNSPHTLPGEDVPHDPDEMMHVLAVALGLVENTDESFRMNKSLYWTNNKTATFLNNMMFLLAEEGILEHNLETAQWTWNHDYDPSEPDENDDEDDDE